MTDNKIKNDVLNNLEEFLEKKEKEEKEEPKYIFSDILDELNNFEISDSDLSSLSDEEIKSENDYSDFEKELESIELEIKLKNYVNEFQNSEHKELLDVIKNITKIVSEFEEKKIKKKEFLNKFYQILIKK